MNARSDDHSHDVNGLHGLSQAYRDAARAVPDSEPSPALDAAILAAAHRAVAAKPQVEQNPQGTQDDVQSTQVVRNIAPPKLVQVARWRLPLAIAASFIVGVLVVTLFVRGKTESGPQLPPLAQTEREIKIAKESASELPAPSAMSAEPRFESAPTPQAAAKAPMESAESAVAGKSSSASSATKGFSSPQVFSRDEAKPGSIQAGQADQAARSSQSVLSETQPAIPATPAESAQPKTAELEQKIAQLERQAMAPAADVAAGKPSPRVLAESAPLAPSTSAAPAPILHGESEKRATTGYGGQSGRSASKDSAPQAFPEEKAFDMAKKKPMAALEPELAAAAAPLPPAAAPARAKIEAENRVQTSAPVAAEPPSVTASAPLPPSPASARAKEHSESQVTPDLSNMPKPKYSAAPPMAKPSVPADAVAVSAPPRPMSPIPPMEARKLSKAESALLNPKNWLEQIEKLRQEGKVKEARESLAEFRKHYPDYQLPKELRDW